MRAAVVEIPREKVNVRKDSLKRHEVYAILDDGSEFILTTGTTPNRDIARSLAEKYYDDEYRINNPAGRPTARRGFGPSVEFDLVRRNNWTVTEAGGVYTEALNREIRRRQYE